MDVKCYRKSFKSPKDGKGDKWIEDKATNTLNCFDNGDIRTSEIICYSIEHHPQDSREKIREDGIVQTLPANMGTGGLNIPLVLRREWTTESDEYAG